MDKAKPGGCWGSGFWPTAKDEVEGEQLGCMCDSEPLLTTILAVM
jgi:hypothetical protein